MAADPLAVRCPDCLAPEGVPCGDRTHAGRRDRARYRAATPGTCALCSQTMIQATDPVETWHPSTVETPCPPEPSTNPYDVDGWHAFFAAGLRSGQPGDQHFIPNPEEQP